jgi:hypothetical protein
MTRFLVSLLVCGLGLVALSGAADPPAKMPKDTCVKPCWDCQAECLNCMKHAREHKMEDLAKQCEVCHHACLICYHAVGSKNQRSWEVCELCEKVCNDCATMCEKSTDEHAKKCAKACHDCAKACAEARK